MAYKYKRIYLTEKNKQVEALALAIGAKKKTNALAYKEDEGVAIVALQGHLLVKEDTKVIAEKLDRFKEETIDNIPQRFDLFPAQNTKAKYETAIAHIKEAEEIVIATDFDEEGAAIALNMIEAGGAQDRIAFMLEMGSTHPKELLKFINNPTDIDYKNLAESARARAWIDFCEGMYLSRASSVYIGNNYAVKLNYGGVKAPLNYIVVERTLAHKNHEKNYYWAISGTADYNGSTFKYKVRKKVDGKWQEKFDTEQEAQKIIDEISQNPIKIAEFKEKVDSTAPPKLYDLTALQSEMSQKYSINSVKSMELAQKVYDTPVSIQSYPRSEIPYLKSSEFEDVPAILGKLKDQKVINPELIEPILSGKIPKRSTTFNDKKVVAHGAIVPTLSGDYDKWLQKLSEGHVKMFLLVAKRYVANFMPDYKYTSIIGSSATYVIDDNEYQVYFSENIPKEAGWKAIYDEFEEKTRTIPEGLKSGDTFNIVNHSLEKKETKPKPLWTEATLMLAMKNIASLFPDNKKIQEHLKDNGLGTTSTRTKILEESMDVARNGGEPALFEEKKKILPSQKTIEYVSAMPGALVSPVKRAVLSEKLKRISRGELTYDELINEYRGELKNSIEAIKEAVKKNGPIKGSGKANGAPDSTPLGKCIMCDGEIIEKAKIYMCNRAKFKKEGDNFINEGCTYKILKAALKNMGKPNLTVTEVKKFLDKKELEVTLKAKESGNSYKKFIIPDEKWGVKVDFDRKVEGKSLGKCPLCDGTVSNNGFLYACSNNVSKTEGCQYKIFKNCLDRFGKSNLSEAEVEKFLKNGKMEVVLLKKGSGEKYTAEIEIDEKWGVKVNFGG